MVESLVPKNWLRDAPNLATAEYAEGKACDLLDAAIARARTLSERLGWVVAVGCIGALSPLIFTAPSIFAIWLAVLAGAICAPAYILNKMHLRVLLTTRRQIDLSHLSLDEQGDLLEEAKAVWISSDGHETLLHVALNDDRAAMRWSVHSFLVPREEVCAPPNGTEGGAAQTNRPHFRTAY